MKVTYKAKEKDPNAKQTDEACKHQYLRANKQTKDKECINCGRVIYLGTKLDRS